MKRMQIIRIIAAIIILMSGGLSFAETLPGLLTGTIPPTEIDMRVTADGDLQYLIQSYIKRELKSLGYVNVYDNSTSYQTRNITSSLHGYWGDYIPDWDIGIVAIEPLIGTRKLDSVILSVTILRNYETCLDSVNLSALAQFEIDHRLLSKVVDHRLIMVTKSDLQRACSEIVAKFDVEHSPITTSADIIKIQNEIERGRKFEGLSGKEYGLKIKP
ncbi:MAG: hypothetical protein MRK01_02655 [Candidatus Scalindua sp.]|nr:hypothetical protein [Candidatus Scalindua sp.]